MAAKAKSSSPTSSHIAKPKRKRPGMHAKSKTSRSKKSKNYRKPYVGQGK